MTVDEAGGPVHDDPHMQVDDGLNATLKAVAVAVGAMAGGAALIAIAAKQIKSLK